MAYQLVTLKREGRIATVLLNRPPTNALSGAFGRELFDAFREVDGMEDVTVVIVASALEKAFMAAAVAPSAQMALEQAGIKAGDLGVVKTHNPFAVNDVVMAKAMGLDANGMNNFGSSLVYGHPQAPTGGRLIIEGIEELVLKGGGYLLFSGCAAGDTAASLVLKVG